VKERSLVIFTLLAQTAAGASAWLAALTFISGGVWVALPVALIEALILAAALLSLTHLGRPRNAWRALGNLRRSWLSREIFTLLLYALTWGLFALAVWFLPGEIRIWHFLGLIGALTGLALIFCMARLYRLPAVPDWDNNRTLTAFFLTAFLLGGLWVGFLLALTAPSHPMTPGLLGVIAVSCAIILASQSILSKMKRLPPSRTRLAATACCLLLWFLSASGSSALLSLLALLGFFLASLGETAVRFEFYQTPQQRLM